MNLKHLKNILNAYSDSELEDIGLWINCCDEVNYILVDKNNINLITENVEIKIDGYIEQEGDRNNESNRFIK